MSLEAQANDRKSRLAALAALRNKRTTGPDNTVDNQQPIKKAANEKTTTIKSRNFDHSSRTEIKGSEAPPLMQDENSETVEAVSQRIQDEVLAKFRAQSDITALEVSEKPEKPRSLAWDLKRDIQEDLDRLHDQTDEAIRQLVKQRIRQLRENAPSKEEE